MADQPERMTPAQAEAFIERLTALLGDTPALVAALRFALQSNEEAYKAGFKDACRAYSVGEYAAESEREAVERYLAQYIAEEQYIDDADAVEITLANVTDDEVGRLLEDIEDETTDFDKIRVNVTTIWDRLYDEGRLTYKLPVDVDEKPAPEDEDWTAGEDNDLIGSQDVDSDRYDSDGPGF